MSMLLMIRISDMKTCLMLDDRGHPNDYLSQSDENDGRSAKKMNDCHKTH